MTEEQTRVPPGEEIYVQGVDRDGRDGVQAFPLARDQLA